VEKPLIILPTILTLEMLRHRDRRATQGYLGHRSIISTQRYTALAPAECRFLTARV
jgi:site-specific recombinase XerD